MSARQKLIFPILALALAMLACNLPGPVRQDSSAPTLDLIATLTAIPAAASHTPPPTHAAPTAAPAPTETEAPPEPETTDSGVPEVAITPLLPPSPPVSSSGGGAVPAGAARLNFAANATDAVRTGSLNGGQMKEYVLRALKGQIMIVSVSSPDDSVVLSVYAPASGQVFLSKAAGQANWQDYLPATQDYVVRATATGGNTSYTLQVTIPEVIRFNPGAISARRSSPISAREIHFYSLRAIKGQTMSVDITSADGDVLLTVYGFTDGQPYKRYQVGGPSTSFVLPATQDYIIEAVSVRDSATSFTLDVTVQ